MSQENVEVLRTVFALWNEDDLSAIIGHLDPAVQLESPLSSVSGRPYTGHAGIVDWRRDLYEQFAAWRLSVDSFRGIGDAVIAVGHIALRGRSSGVSFDQQTAWVAAFRADHLITKLTVYLEVEAALEAVGLTE
jgi:ketosteroid isomerase-like protein